VHLLSAYLQALISWGKQKTQCARGFSVPVCSSKMTTVETEFEEDSFEDDFEPEEEMEQYK